MERRKNQLLRDYFIINQEIDRDYPGKPRGHRPVKSGVDRCFKHNQLVQGCSGWVGLCRICLDQFNHSPEYLRSLVESQYVLCPNCAWEEAILEDAQREVEAVFV
jgi:hypothetical protein